MPEYKQLKFYFGKELAELLSKKIETVYPEFNSSSFINTVDINTRDLELKDRVEVITDSLKELLPEKFEDAVGILIDILGPENQSETGMFREFYWLMPVSFFIEKYGLGHFKLSIKAIEEITKRNTGEYAIRPFIVIYPEKTLSVMISWSLSNNFHVRRLASEGSRPRLPWSKKLNIFIDDPSPVLPILENLKSDPVLFVRKSVANHLNDLLKENYDFAFNILSQWSKNPTHETKWIIKHALRNQIKKGNKEAARIIMDK